MHGFERDRRRGVRRMRKHVPLCRVEAHGGRLWRYVEGYVVGSGGFYNEKVEIHLEKFNLLTP